jgi:hypothetical protein
MSTFSRVILTGFLVIAIGILTLILPILLYWIIKGIPNLNNKSECN